MIRFSLVFFFIILSVKIFAQNQILNKIEFNSKTIDSGEYKNYNKFELGNLWLLNGRLENNLRFKILDFNKQQILFEFNYLDSDAMILKPKVFMNSDSSIKVLMIEVAAEYSWGHEIVLMINNKIYQVGFLNYEVRISDSSIADYCFLEGNQNKIIISFQDVPIINYDDEDEIIQGKDLKFELSTKEIKRIN